MRNHETNVCRVSLLKELVDSTACGSAVLQFLFLILFEPYQLYFKGFSMCCIISGLSKEIADKMLYHILLKFGVFLFQICYILVKCLNIFTTAGPFSKCHGLTLQETNRKGVFFLSQRLSQSAVFELYIQ